MALNVCSSVLCPEKSRIITNLLNVKALSNRTPAKKKSLMSLSAFVKDIFAFLYDPAHCYCWKVKSSFQTSHGHKLEPRRKLT